MNVQILIYDGVDELDAIGPFEVFENAGRILDREEQADDSCRASLVTLEPADEVRASHGLSVVPDGTLGDPDLLVVPGGGWNTRASRGAWAEAERGTIPDAVAATHDRGTVVAGVCTGGMLLGRACLLDDLPAVTHAGALDDLRKTQATVVDARVVDAGSVLTAGGVTSGLDLALHLVEREFRPAVADRVADVMAYERQGNVHRVGE